MKIVARKESEKAELKSRILNEARKIIVRDGFGALSIRKLAFEIGYTPGNIYLYFASRDEIAREICREGFNELLAAIQPAAKSKDPSKRLVKMLEAYANFAVAHPETYKLAFMQDPKFNEEMFRQTAVEEESGAGRKAFLLIVNALEELKDGGKIKRQTDTTQLAEVLWAGVHGVVSLKLISPFFPATQTKTLVERMIETLLNGLYLR